MNRVQVCLVLSTLFVGVACKDEMSLLPGGDVNLHAYYESCALEDVPPAADVAWLAWEPLGSGELEIRRVRSGEAYVIGVERDTDCVPLWQREMSVWVRQDGHTSRLDGIAMHGYDTKWSADWEPMEGAPFREMPSYSYSGAGDGNMNGALCSQGYSPQRVMLSTFQVLDGTSEQGQYQLVCQIDGDFDSGGADGAMLAEW